MREYASEWTDAAANKVLEALHDDCKKHSLQIVQNTMDVLLDMQRARALVKRGRVRRVPASGGARRRMSQKRSSTDAAR